MSDKKNEIPVTGSFGQPSNLSGEPPKSIESSADDMSTQEVYPEKPFDKNPLEGVLKEENVVTEIPRQPSETSGAQKSFKKVLALLVFLILIISTVVFSVGLFKSLRDKGSDTDLSDKSGEIVWWGIEDREVYSEVISLYESANREAKITYIQQPERQYVRRLSNALSKGESPDIFSIHNSWVDSYQSHLDPFPNELFTVEELEEVYFATVANDLIRDENLLAIPLEYDGLALFVNEDIFAASGYEIPGWWDQLKQLSLDLTQTGQGRIIAQSGIALGIIENVDHWQEIVGVLMYQNGVNPANPLGEKGQTVIDYFNSFSQLGVWDTSFPPSTLAFARADTAMIFGTLRSARLINADNANLRFRIVPVPQVRKDDRTEMDIGYATYWAEAVWRNSKEKGLAYDFLKFLSDPKNLTTISQASEAIYGVPKIIPRRDLQQDNIATSIYSGVLATADVSKSWYLADKTYDDPEGINFQVAEVYKGLLVSGGQPELIMELVSKLGQVISYFGSQR